MKTDPVESKSKKKEPFIFYIIMWLIPILILVFVEMGLRIAGYGNEFQLFKKVDTYVPGMLYVNPEISHKYFGNTKAPVFQQDIGFQEKKPEDSFRVFVLGGSSTQGFPYARNASFPAHLQRHLDLMYPNRVIEVVNLGASAINSYTLLDILPQVLEQSPDLILIYAGHNEYYGALGPGSTQLGSPRLVRFYLYLKNFRIVQWIENLLSGSPPENSGEDTSLMQEMIAQSSIGLGSDIYQKGIDQFDYNLNSILKKIKKSNVPVVIGTVSSNLSGHPPFNSDQADSAGLTASDHFALGEERLLKDSIAAKSHFIQAKELDGLRFRAPEEINEIIHSKAKEYSIPLVDIDSIFNRNSFGSVVGDNLMCDHLHPNRQGYFLMSKSFLQAMLKQGYLTSKSSEKTNFKPLPDSILQSAFPYTQFDSLVDQRLLLTGLGRYPFVPAGSPNPYQDILDNDGLAHKITALSDVDSIRSIVAGEHLIKGDTIAFRKEMKVFMSYFPVKEQPYLKTINYLIENRLADKAYPIIFEELQELKESRSKTKMIGLYYKYIQNYELAKSYLEKAIQDSSEDAYLLLDLGFVYLVFQKHTKAIDVFSKVIEILPDNIEAYHQRAVASFELKNYSQTIKDMDQVIKLSEKPDPLPSLIRGYAKMALDQKTKACEDWKASARYGSTEASNLQKQYCKAQN